MLVKQFVTKQKKIKKKIQIIKKKFGRKKTIKSNIIYLFQLKTFTQQIKKILTNQIK